jgi:DNA mismatch endonuclease (patch repair protein)
VAGWVSTEAGRHLAGRSKQDTKPELLLRSAVHRLGLRFAVQKRIAKGCTPDFVLVRHRLAVFVDGCFWHQCPVHGRTSFAGPNASRWSEKMQRNKVRDQRADELAAAAGYRVLRLWECAVMLDPAAAAMEVATAASLDKAASHDR